ncbi:MAG TPA: bifunctional precorrin-2 dehydrogenase/sirohydrochlorin ferrochelatase [Candidatus Scybalomonas excrementigallinarum]|nr:bifunctional precorrin-2 dehydrogenase/sirohydrochlorin ferrochelatase [Candidatus Scybalomonas excrementigallinarum]
MAYFPMFMELKGKKCLVIGGGSVAYRKIKTLLEYEIEIIVIASDFLAQIKELEQKNKERISCITKEISSMEELKGYHLNKEEISFIICATNKKGVNQRIACWCRENRIPVNVVDQKELCTFLFPAVVKKGDVSVGITTSGVSPVASSYLRECIEEIVDDNFLEFLDEIGEYRIWLKNNVEREEERREKLRQKMEDWKQRR